MKTRRGWIQAGFIVLGILGLVLMAAVALGKDIEKNNARLACYSHGYTELRGRRGDWYCAKRSGWQDVIVPLKELEGE